MVWQARDGPDRSLNQRAGYWSTRSLTYRLCVFAYSGEFLEEKRDALHSCMRSISSSISKGRLLKAAIGFRHPRVVLLPQNSHELIAELFAHLLVGGFVYYVPHVVGVIPQVV